MKYSGIYIKRTRNRGMSLFAAKDFRKGQLLFKAEGPVTKKFTRYTIPIDLHHAIDPVPSRNPARYLNHSCEPSAGIKRKINVVTFRNIRKGEEITIDYAMIVDKYGKEILPKKYRKCKCGSKNCRGELGSWLKLPDEIKKKYKDFVSDYLLEL